MKGGRTLTVDGSKYEYRVGKDATVVRTLDNKVFAKFYNPELIGVSWDTYERGQYKRTSDGAVMPSHIADAVRRVVRLRKSDPTYARQPPKSWGGALRA
jgi:hypothetical protein